MGHSRGDGCANRLCRCTGLLAAMLLGIHCPAVRAETWIWTGLGGDDNWSTASNWSSTSPAPPTNLYTTTLIFDGQSRLTPAQDIDDSFQFGNMVFATNAGAFLLGGTNNVCGQWAWRSLQFAGANPCLTVFGGSNVLIRGPMITRDAHTNNTISVASGMTLQVPWIKGGQWRVVVKKGAGTLRVYEHADGQYYLESFCDVGPEYRVEDGTVEMGTWTNRHVLASDNVTWKAASNEVKVSYNLTVGDGVGSATSAVFRLIGPAQKQLIDNNLAITVNADGLLDLNGVQDWDTTNAPCLAVSNGLVRMGSSSLYVRNGRTLELRGGARIEGDGNSAIRFYDGATAIVDGLATCAVLAASAALVSAANGAGVVFQVSGCTGDVAALAVTGHLGAEVAGSHLVKRGAGTMAIKDLTHALRTNRVEEGVLLLNGLSRCAALSGAAQWVVLTNATLGGGGIISNATVLLQGGTIDPGGATAGTLTIASNLLLAAGATLAFDLARANSASGGTNDQLVIQNGAVAGLSNAALRIDINDQLNVDGQRFRVISGGGNFTGQSFGAVSLTGCRGRYAEVTVGNGYVDVTIRNLYAGTGLIMR